MSVKLRDNIIKQGERVLSLFDEKDKDSVIAWQIALEDKNIEANKRYYTKEQVETMIIYFGITAFIFFIILVVFLGTRPDGWPNECPNQEECKLSHREEINWQRACNGGIGDAVFCSEDDITWIADIGRWKCESFGKDSVEFKCKANLQTKESY
jgi:hypothetical protein